MKRLTYLLFIVFFALNLSACAKPTPEQAKATPEQVEGMLNPGDKIGDFLITTGDRDVTYNWELGSACKKQGNAEVYSCQLTVGTKVNVSVGIFDETRSDKLDSNWSGLTYEMLIDDHPVNLQAFGFIDVSHPTFGTLRYWNVVITTTQPGEITVTNKGIESDGTPLGDTTTYTFTAP